MVKYDDSNFIERYTAWAEGFTDAPPQFHRFVAYWVLSTLLGRRVYMHLGDERLFPNLWLVVLAPSSFYRKSTALSIGSRMASSVNKELLLPSEWSQECFITLMSQQSHGAMVCYEFRGLLAQLQKDYNFGAQSLLTELYDCPPEYVRKKGTTEVKEFRIEQPYLTILGASTLEWLINSVQSGDIAGGFLARFLFVSADHKDKVLAIQPPAPENERLIVRTALEEALKVEGEMRYSAEAEQHYRSWYARFVDEAEKAPEGVRAFFPRLTAYAHKFAMLEAVLNNHCPEVTLDDCRRACLMAENFAAEIRKLGRESLGKSKFDHYRLRIIKAVTKKPGIEHSQLLRNLGLPAKVFKDVVETLKQTGEIDIRDGAYYPVETGSD